jgi:hypothetical protein
MLRFEVKQEDAGRWTVSSQGRTLYLSPTEEGARVVALALASDVSASGRQASVLITPAQAAASGASKSTARFTGM